MAPLLSTDEVHLCCHAGVRDIQPGQPGIRYVGRFSHDPQAKSLRHGLSNSLAATHLKRNLNCNASQLEFILEYASGGRPFLSDDEPLALQII